MLEIINLEQTVLDNLRLLPKEKQQEVLDFVQFLVQKNIQITPLSSDSSITQPVLTLSLQEIARLPVTERHQILAPFIAATAEDFLTDPELTEFSVLDGEDWENNDPN
jgi:hypothetical protein